MQDSLVLHDDTKRLIEQLRKKPPQALLLHSDRHLGLRRIALLIADAHALVIAPEKGASIKVEHIRTLYEQTRTKSTSRQYVVINDADMMTHSAQSAFLKLLEEPGQSVFFLLTTHRPDQLLDTIRSRVQQFRITPPTKGAVRDFISSLTPDQTVRRQVEFLADGSPSMAARYFADTALFQADSIVMVDARTFLMTRSNYEKCLIALRHATERQEALQFVDYVIRLSQFSLNKEDSTASYARLSNALLVRERIARNANIKLALTQLVLK